MIRLSNKQWQMAYLKIARLFPSFQAPRHYSKKLFPGVQSIEKCGSDWKTAVSLVYDMYEREATSPSASNSEAVSELVQSLNATIHICAKSKRTQEVLDLFKLMYASKAYDQENFVSRTDSRRGHVGQKVLRVSPTLESYFMTIKALSQQRKWKDILDVMAMMERDKTNNIKPNVHIMEEVMQACNKNGDWEKSLKYLDWYVEQHQGKVSVFMINNVMNTCLKDGQWIKALDIYQTLDSKYGVLPNIATNNIAINACAKGFRWQKALDILNSMMVDEKESTGIAAIDSLSPGRVSNRNDINGISRASRGVKPTIVSFNSAISACANAGEYLKALELLVAMEKKYNISPDAYSFSGALSACEKAGKFQKAQQVFNLMQKRNIPLNIIVMNTMIGACGKGGNWQLAIDFYKSMRQQYHITPDARSISSVMTACSENGQYLKTLELFSSIEQDCHHKQKANVIHYTIAITACAKAGLHEKALEIFDSMDSKKGHAASVPRNIAHYNATITACEKAGEWEKALEIFHLIAKNRLHPTEISFSAAISACEKGNQYEKALELFDMMKKTKNIKPNVITFSALISACGKAGQWEKALELFDTMQPEHDVKPNEITFNALIEALESSGQYGKAVEMLQLAQTRKYDLYNNLWSFCGSVDDDLEKKSSAFVELNEDIKNKTLKLDLHRRPASVARTLIRLLFLDLEVVAQNKQKEVTRNRSGSIGDSKVEKDSSFGFSKRWKIDIENGDGSLVDDKSSVSSYKSAPYDVEAKKRAKHIMKNGEFIIITGVGGLEKRNREAVLSHVLPPFFDELGISNSATRNGNYTTSNEASNNRHPVKDIAGRFRVFIPTAN